MYERMHFAVIAHYGGSDHVSMVYNNEQAAINFVETYGEQVPSSAAGRRACQQSQRGSQGVSYRVAHVRITELDDNQAAEPFGGEIVSNDPPIQGVPEYLDHPALS